MIWIRTQDKETLIKCNYIDLDELNVNDGIEYVIVGGLSPTDIDNLGTYKSQERCLEILDEIEETLLTTLRNAINKYEMNYIYHMPKE